MRTTGTPIGAFSWVSAFADLHNTAAAQEVDIVADEVTDHDTG